MNALFRRALRYKSLSPQRCWGANGNNLLAGRYCCEGDNGDDKRYVSSALLTSRSPVSGELEYGVDRDATFKETDIMVSARVVFILDRALNLYKRFI